MQYTLLNSHLLICVSGKDAMSLLQGQLTCDVNRATAEEPLLGALCDTKGRVIASFYLWKIEKEYYLQLPKENAPFLMKYLQKYAYFSEVTLSQVQEVQILGFWDETKVSSCLLFNSFRERKELKGTEKEWMLACIQKGIVFITPEISGVFTPHDLAYPQLGFVSFDKGCYTGQEIVARMHYLGKLKQHLYLIRFHTQEVYKVSDKLCVDERTAVQIVAIVETDNFYFESLVVGSEKAINTLSDNDENFKILNTFC